MTSDASALTAPVNGHLDYLSQLTQQLGVPDPVETYLVPVLGRWSDLHDEAGRWRAAAQVASAVTTRLTAPLAGLDAAWQGADADSFLEYMRNVGLAGHDLADALGAMADALDRTADGIRQIAREMVDMLVDTAEQSSEAMTVPVAGASRAAQHLDDVARPSSQMYESVRDVLDAFVKLCDGVQGGQLFGRITMAHKMPTQNWSPPATPMPPAPAPVGATPPPSAPPAAPPPSAPPAAPPPSAPPAAPPSSASQPAAAAAPAHAGGIPAHTAAGGAGVHAGGGGVPAAGAGMAAQQAGPGAQSSAVATPSGSVPPPVPGATPPETAGSAAAGGGGGMPMMGGMGGMGGRGGGDSEHKSKIGVSGDPREIFGKPERTAPPVIGEE